MKCYGVLCTFSVLILGSQTLGDDFAVGRFGADTIFVQPIAGPSGLQTFRASVSVSPLDITTDWGKLSVLPVEVQGSVAVGSGEIVLSRARATALRMTFTYFTVDAGTYVRNLDSGMPHGAEFLSIQVPFSLTTNGEIVIVPNMEMGIHHFQAPGVDATSFHTSFGIDARAAIGLIRNWLQTGIMAKVRYDLDTAGLGGLEAGGMGYLSLLLSRDHRMYARVYAGADYVQMREHVGQPTGNFFTGIGIHGNFTRK